MIEWEGLGKFLIGEKVSIVFKDQNTPLLSKVEVLEYAELGLLYADEKENEIGFIPWTAVSSIFKTLPKNESGVEAKQ